MDYLFDTNALSELLRPRPNRRLVKWVSELHPARQFTSAVVVSELYAGAFRTPNRAKWLARIVDDVLPRVQVLPFDLVCARACGELDAYLSAKGGRIGRADVEIAATALVHGMTLVTANLRHFERVPKLALHAFVPGEQ